MSASVRLRVMQLFATAILGIVKAADETGGGTAPGASQYSTGRGLLSHRYVEVNLLHWLQVYEEPTVLLAKRVTGEEEVPEGCVAVVTPDAPDVLSHVSVRARNMRVLFAICHEAQPLADIEQLAGKVRSHGI